MVHRLIGLAIAGAVISGFSNGARSGTLSQAAETSNRLHAARATPLGVASAIAKPAKPQIAGDGWLANIATTRWGSFMVSAGDGAPTASTVTANCASACVDSVRVPLGDERSLAKPFSAQIGAGQLLAAGTATQTLAAQTEGVELTSNSVVASVELKLKKNIIAADGSQGYTTQLLITARDPSGAVIVGPDSYVDRNGKPLVIRIVNSSPSNTDLTPTEFTKPMPSLGASNVAKITYDGRAHFHYPTFTVANRGLPSMGVTLIYAPTFGPLSFEQEALCIGSFPSVGGYYYGGPFFALAHSQECPLLKQIPVTADIGRFVGPGSPVTYQVNPKHNSVVQLGFGWDKNIYFAYDDSASTARTAFGYLRRPSVRTSANVSFVSKLTLGNDHGLWFSGVTNGHATIGKLPPARILNWRPELYSVPGADNVFSIEPGIGNTEALLYRSHGIIYVGTINTDLSGFKSVPVLAYSADLRIGDLLAGRDGNFYVSAASSSGSSVYKITNRGKLSQFCPNVFPMYRLPDGTGIGEFRNDLVHVVPGEACTHVPVFDSFGETPGLLGVDTTTDDWILYTFPSGHRLGVF